MRKLIAGFKISLDGKFEGPEGMADWVNAWSDEYGLTDQVDACLLGGGMYPGYEQYWTAVQNAPHEPLWQDRPPTPEEVEWARFAKRTPHYVLSTSLTSAQWPNTRILRSIDDVAALKREDGKDIYLVGGGHVAASLLDAGLVDEIRLIVYPLVSGSGPALFATAETRHALELRKSEQLSDGRLSLTYDVH